MARKRCIGALDSKKKTNSELMVNIRLRLAQRQDLIIIYFLSLNKEPLRHAKPPIPLLGGKIAILVEFVFLKDAPSKNVVITS